MGQSSDFRDGDESSTFALNWDKSPRYRSGFCLYLVNSLMPKNRTSILSLGVRFSDPGFETAVCSVGLNSSPSSGWES